MTIRDLGYRPYDGPRNPPSANVGVMIRQSLRRVWASWLVKIAVALAVLGSVIYAATCAAIGYLGSSMGSPLGLDAVTKAMRWFLFLDMGIVGLMVTVGGGATAIADDVTFNAFQFYFSKPVSAVQYLAGRFLAVSIWLFGLVFFPALLVLLAFMGTAEDQVGERAGLILPTLLYALIVALCLSTTSVATSAINKRRAVTTGAWLVAFFVPLVAGTLVHWIAQGREITGGEAPADAEGWPWLLLLSIPSLIDRLGSAIFNAEAGPGIDWWQCALLLTAYACGSIALAWWRVRRVEVIT